MLDQRPLLLPFLALAAGLTVTDQTGYHLPLYVLAAALACLVLSAQIRRGPLFATCISLTFFALGLCALSPWKNPPVSSDSIRAIPPSVPVTLQGVVASRPVVSSTGTTLVVRTEQIIRAGRPEGACGELLL